MSIDVRALVEQGRLAADRAAGAPAGVGTDRARLARIAAEFESMLLVQVLRDMRQAGKWEDEEPDGLRAESLFETLDVELASHLARAQGFGLTRQLLEAFDRLQGETPGQAALALPAASPGGAMGAASMTALGAAPGMVSEGSTLDDPVPGRVTSEFGWRRDPFTGRARFHKGVDLHAAYGQEVQAAAHGRVIHSGELGGYGLTVEVEHADGTRTRYAHLSATLVGKEDVVAAGQVVGRVGSSGRATGAHLHFEVMDAAGNHVNPRDGR